MQKKNFIHFSFFLFIIWLAVGGLVAGDNSENLFFRNNLIPSFTSSLFLKLPENIKFRSDNFYSSPNSLFFLTIRNLSKNITKDLLKYQDKEVEIKVYSLVDRLKSEIFPYSEKYDTRGILISSSEKPIGIFCLNSNIISSIDGKNFISVDISEENLERFFKKYKSISMTKRDVYLKNLSPENILKDMVLSFNNKQFDDFYSCFSLKFKFNSVIENFTKNNSFNYDANQTFFGNIPDIKNIKISNIKNSLSATSQLSSIVIYETTFVLTDKNNQEIEKKYFLFLNYSQNFGYRIYEIKNENPNIEASL